MIFPGNNTLPILLSSYLFVFQFHLITLAPTNLPDQTKECIWYCCYNTKQVKAFFWGFLGLKFSTDKIFCKTNSQDSNKLF